MLKPLTITTTNLADAWFQCLYSIVKIGRTFTIDRGSYAGQKRLEFDYITVHITMPHLRCADGLPLIPEIPEGMGIPAPVTKDFIRQYMPYLMTAAKKPGEDYTYGERLKDATVQYPGAFFGGKLHLDQIEHIIDIYKKHGHRNNQMVLQIAQPRDLLLTDPPCLREIDTRIQNDKLHFFPRFRSWDLWGGFPANLAGISYLQEYMASEIGVEQGEMICSSKGLHLYDYSVDIAKVRCHI